MAPFTTSRRGDRKPFDRGERKPPKPLDAARLEELALAYVARFATSRAKLEAYLTRKLRERGWTDGSGEDEGSAPPPVAAIAERFVAAGYVDDTAYARAKSGSLLRRGYGQRRVSEALGAAGIDEGVRAEVRAGEGAQRHAALAMVRKRRFGPYGLAKADGEPLDRPVRDKQISAMLRAGHAMDSVRELVDATSIGAAEEWARSCDDLEDDEPCD